MLVGEVGTLVPAMLIAEEKEKKTLEVLMLSPAKPVEVFTGKGLLTLVTMLLFAVLVMLIAGTPGAAYPLILLSTILVSVTCIIIGMIVGLLAQNQMATGIIGLPVFLPFIMLPFLSFGGNESSSISTGLSQLTIIMFW
jgi:ABC-2 type transport system permease protein